MASNEAARLDEGTLLTVARALEQRIEAVERAGGCPACHEVELRRLLVQLRHLAQEAAPLPVKAA